MTDILIGIDLGTTVLKAAAVDGASGRALAGASLPLPVRAHDDGRREQEPKEILAALRGALARLRRLLGRDWRRVAGLGLAAQGGSAMLVDAAAGKAHTPMQLWSDGRAHAYLSEIKAAKPLRSWQALALRDEPGAGLGRLAWFREHHPEAMREGNLYAGAGEYVYFHLTGQWRQDAGNAVQIGCYDVRKKALAAWPLELLGVTTSFVAPMREGHATHPLSAAAARAFGLPPGIPVAGPYMDHEAGYLSAARPGRRPLQCSLGTAWVGNLVLPDDTTGGSPFQIVCPAPVGEGRLVIQPLLTGNNTWDWGLTTFVHTDHRQALREVEHIFNESLLPPRGLVALPWMGWPNPWLDGGFGAGCFLGLNPTTSPEDMLRALAAGLTFEMTRVFDEVRTSGAVDCLTLGGGAGKSQALADLLAALFAPLPVHVVEDEDLAGARGALHVFGAKASRASLRRVKRPVAALCRAARARYDDYRSLHQRLYGDVVAGGAFTFKGAS